MLFVLSCFGLYVCWFSSHVCNVCMCCLHLGFYFCTFVLCLCGCAGVYFIGFVLLFVLLLVLGGFLLWLRLLCFVGV